LRAAKGEVVVDDGNLHRSAHVSDTQSENQDRRKDEKKSAEILRIAFQRDTKNLSGAGVRESGAVTADGRSGDDGGRSPSLCLSAWITLVECSGVVEAGVAWTAAAAVAVAADSVVVVGEPAVAVVVVASS
jgi:hypothetical protein